MSPTTDSIAAPVTVAPHGADVLGYPRTLIGLLATEVWERFSFFGMRALLVLFLTAPLMTGGLGLGAADATAAYGLYVGACYLTALPGGWVSDRWLGAAGAVWLGGLVIALGHIVLAVSTVTGSTEPTLFFGALGLVAAGTGLLKPSIAALVGAAFADADPRRDAGFAVFYMSANVGAVAGGLMCGYLADRMGWHYGFGAAAMGMFLGLAAYSFMGGSSMVRADRATLVIGASILVLVLGALLAGDAAGVDPVVFAGWASTVVAAISLAFFLLIFFGGKLGADERGGVLGVLVLFAAGAVFILGFEQAGSSLTLFAERSVSREMLGFAIPASWYQALNPVLVIVLTPVLAAGWVRLARHGYAFGTAAKLALGLASVGLGFLLAAAAAGLASDGKVASSWLLGVYVLHTFGELCIAPVSLSAVSRLAPKRYLGQMIGIWYMSAALGSVAGGLLAGWAATGKSMAGGFFGAAGLLMGAALLFVIAGRRLRPLGL